MKRDIRRLGDYLLEVTREGLAIERKILLWKEEEEKKQAEPLAKAS